MTTTDSDDYHRDDLLRGGSFPSPVSVPMAEDSGLGERGLVRISPITTDIQKVAERPWHRVYCYSIQQGAN